VFSILITSKNSFAGAAARQQKEMQAKKAEVIKQMEFSNVKKIALERVGKTEKELIDEISESFTEPFDFSENINDQISQIIEELPECQITDEIATAVMDEQITTEALEEINKSPDYLQMKEQLAAARATKAKFDNELSEHKRLYSYYDKEMDKYRNKCKKKGILLTWTVNCEPQFSQNKALRDAHGPLQQIAASTKQLSIEYLTAKKIIDELDDIEGQVKKLQQKKINAQKIIKDAYKLQDVCEAAVQNEIDRRKNLAIDFGGVYSKKLMNCELENRNGICHCKNFPEPPVLEQTECEFYIFGYHCCKRLNITYGEDEGYANECAHDGPSYSKSSLAFWALHVYRACIKSKKTNQENIEGNAGSQSGTGTTDTGTTDGTNGSDTENGTKGAE